MSSHIPHLLAVLVMALTLSSCVPARPEVQPEPSAAAPQIGAIPSLTSAPPSATATITPTRTVTVTRTQTPGPTTAKPTGQRTHPPTQTPVNTATLRPGEIRFLTPFPTAPVSGPPLATPTWAEPTEPPPAPTPIPGALMLDEIRFVDARTAYAVTILQRDANFKLISGTFKVIRTTDSGRTWADITPAGIDWGHISAILKGDSPGNEHLWLAVSPDQQDKREETLYYSADGGETWRKSTAPFPHATQLMADSQKGWAVVEGGGGAGTAYLRLYQTSDSGATWTQYKPTNIAQGVYPGTIKMRSSVGFSLPTPNMLWIGGGWADWGASDYYYTRDMGQTWQYLHIYLPDDYGPVYWNQPTFFNDQDGFLSVSATIIVFRRYREEDRFWQLIFSTHDGGKSWIAHPSLETDNRGGINFRSPTDWTILSDGRLLRTRDGGQTWKAYPIADALPLSFEDGRNGWSAQQYWLENGTSFYTVFITHDGGKTWTEVVPRLK